MFLVILSLRNQKYTREKHRNPTSDTINATVLLETLSTAEKKIKIDTLYRYKVSIINVHAIFTRRSFVFFIEYKFSVP